MKTLTLSLLLAISFQAQGAGSIGPPCEGSFVNPITDVCWRCLFPMTIGSAPVVAGEHADTENPVSPIQVCDMELPPYFRIGMSLGYWEPTNIVDATRTPFCLVNLGGVKIDVGAMSARVNGSNTSTKGKLDGAIYNVHWYVYPVIYWLNLIMSATCMQKGNFDIAYLSELDPTWDDDALNIIINPEVALFANPITQIACAVDGILAMNPKGMTLDPLFWCMGNHGSSYPYNGYTQNDKGAVSSSILAAERMAFKLHREAIVWDSIGVDFAVCHDYPYPIMRKSRYRYQMVNTIPDVKDCYPLGHMVDTWQMGHNTPVGGNNFGYLIWKKRNCVFL